MDNISQQTVNQLLENAYSQGSISNQSLNSLMVNDIGAQISAGLHVDIDQIYSSEITLVSMLIDDSGSIPYRNNTQNIIDGHNLVLNSLRGSVEGDDVLIHTRYLNGKVLYRYVTLDNAVEMNTSNYNPIGVTPLYDQTEIMMGTVLTQAQAFLDTGRQCRTITVIVTDGNDEHSRKNPTPESVTLINDAISQETNIVAGFGVNDNSTNFTDIFMRMGIPEKWIITPDDSESALRAAWQLVSKSAIHASQSSQAFLNLGGFEL